MIVLLTGDNSFAVHNELTLIESEFTGAVEKIDGESLELSNVPSLLSGISLFSEKRLVVINNLSSNLKVWTKLTDFLPSISDDVTLVLVDEKPDKRTKTYKHLVKMSDVREFQAWTDKDRGVAINWAVDYAKSQGLSLSRNLAQLLVTRTGVDQWRISNVIGQLKLLDEVSSKTIEDLVPAQPHQNVFSLLDAVIRRDTKTVHEMIDEFSLTEDPHRLLGLLTTQVFQLVALNVSEESSRKIASDIGAHPYMLSKLESAAKRIDRQEIRRLVNQLARADVQMKSVSVDPWVVIRRALI